MHLPTNTRTLGVYDVLVAAGPSGLFHGAVLLTLLVCVKRRDVNLRYGSIYTVYIRNGIYTV
jgi:hypothetical protein